MQTHRRDLSRLLIVLAALAGAMAYAERPAFAASLNGLNAQDNVLDGPIDSQPPSDPGVPAEEMVVAPAFTDCNGNGISDALDVQPGVDFAPAATYASATNAIDVAAADLDGDGDLDLAVPNRNSDDVSVLKNNGDGTFAAAQKYAVGDEPWQVAAADLDGDGDIDLAVTPNILARVFILLNNGTGVFSAGTTAVLTARPWGLAAGDLDGDNDTDLVVGINGSRALRLLRNNGNATFTQSTITSGGYPNEVTAADFDGDGDLDLAVASNGWEGCNWVHLVYTTDMYCQTVHYKPRVDILRNNGSGSFTVQSFEFAYDDDVPWNIEAGDLDGDGDQDVAAIKYNIARSECKLVLFENNGSGQLTRRGVHNLPHNIPNTATSDLVVADLNQDGLADLATCHEGLGGSSSVRQNQGTGSLYTALATSTDFDPQGNAWRLAAADLDGDGKIDLAAANGTTNNVAVLLSDPVPPYSQDTDGNGIPDECELDSDGDGVPDIEDNCPNTPNPGQEDCDGDGVGDACDEGILFVDSSAAGLNDGTSWTNAFRDLQDALATAGECGEIWVATGTYTPADPGGDRSASFHLVDGLSVYGGFAGTETTRDERDFRVNVTVLSGDLAGDDDTVGNGENSYHVVTADSVSATGVLDGVVIEGGNADGGGADDNGGGMTNTFGGPTVTNCVFRNNSAQAAGGGMSNAESSPALTNCVFVGNRIPVGAAWVGGGGMFNNYSNPAVVNCTFSGNAAVVGGAGVLNSGVSSPTLTNCVLWGNADFLGTSESAQISGGAPVVAYSCIEGLTAFAGNDNIGDDPLFVRDPDDGGDGWGVGNNDDYGDLHLQAGSPCMDTGDSTAVPVDVDTDLDGNPRIVGDAVDMGAYEVPPPMLIHICDGLGAEGDPTAFISPKSKYMGFDSVEILVTEDVTLVGSCTMSTGGAPPSVQSVTALGGGLHAVALDGPVELDEWTTVLLTVENGAGLSGELCFEIAHLPGDCNGDGQLNINDATGFGDEFNGAQTLLLADLNDDDQVNINDATMFGKIWNGADGEGKNPDGTGGWQGEGLPARPACTCP